MRATVHTLPLGSGAGKDGMKVTIEVTEKDIAAGIAGDCWECPVALAINRCFPNASSVLAYRWIVEIDDKTISLPEIAVKFIEDPAGLPWVEPEGRV